MSLGKDFDSRRMQSRDCERSSKWKRQGNQGGESVGLQDSRELPAETFPRSSHRDNVTELRADMQQK
jgi:hypothetical protein